ncbi:MAG: hypothetical protein ACJAU0_002402 [Flavobacteriales bacterium]
MRNIGVYVFLLTASISCQPGQPENQVEKGIAAVAYGKRLSWDEIASIVPDNASEEDSSALAERFVNEWLKEQAILSQAEANLSEGEKNFDEELANYRKNLITFAYENKYVQQRLDAVISADEILNYYESNQEIFGLKDYIVKVKFCILQSETPKLKKFRKLFESDASEDLVAVEQFCVDYGASYYLNIDNWMFFEELVSKVPLETYNIESFLRKNPKAEFEKGDKLYFVQVLDYKFKDSVSPLDLVQNQIRSLILNRRKKELLAKMREDLYKSALSSKEIEKLYE